MADLRSGINKILNGIKQTPVNFAEITTKLEQLQFSATLTINVQVKLVTELANCPKFKPQNSIEAEQRVNELLRYLASPKYIVCALACSLLKIFCDSLDKNGQHIATQGSEWNYSVLSQNSLTTSSHAFFARSWQTVCQSIALASMCSIATEWSCKLEQLNQWLPLALLAVNTVFGVLLNSKIHYFIQQVAAEGLKRTLDIPNFWASLTDTERLNTLAHIKQLFDIQLPKPDVFILIKLLDTVANKNVAWSVCTSRYLKDFLQACYKCLPDVNEFELAMAMPLDVRWATLKLLWTLLNGMKVDKITYLDNEWNIYLEKLKPLFVNGVSGIRSIRKLKEEIGHLVSKL